MPEPGFVKIINPATGGIAEVPTSSLRYHYAAGWAPLDEDAEPEAKPEPDPKPVKASAVRASRDKTTPSGDKGSDKEGE